MTADGSRADERMQAVRALAERLFTEAWHESLDDDQQLALNALDAAEDFYKACDGRETELAKAERSRAKRAAAKAGRVSKAGTQ